MKVIKRGQVLTTYAEAEGEVNPFVPENAIKFLPLHEEFTPIHDKYAKEIRPLMDALFRIDAGDPTATNMNTHSNDSMDHHFVRLHHIPQALRPFLVKALDDSGVIYTRYGKDEKEPFTHDDLKDNSFALSYAKKDGLGDPETWAKLRQALKVQVGAANREFNEKVAATRKALRTQALPKLDDLLPVTVMKLAELVEQDKKMQQDPERKKLAALLGASKV